MDIDILKKYWIKAKKSLWQNFLMDDRILDFIASSININWKNVLEVWPWFWALTEKLLTKIPKSLHLVELDREMVEVLNKRIDNFELKIDWIDFQIFSKDILKYVPEFEEYFVVANIPYYITSPILRYFLYNLENKPEKMLILMQKDVWDKIIQWQKATFKKVKTSVLSLFIAKKAYVSDVLKVPSTSFFPIPKVESSVLLFETHDLYNEVDDDIFLEFVKLWFKEQRKKLVNNFIKWDYKKEQILEIFKDLWFPSDIRWEELNIDDWMKLISRF